MERFLDRYAAGRLLAESLKSYAKRPDTLLLALPRGGVPVAYEIAKALSLPLDVFIVRKLGMPGHEEFAIGAIAQNGIVVYNDEILKSYSISKAMLDSIIQTEQQELNRREQAYRDNRPFPVITNKTIILVDDGIATGATMRAAIMALKQQNPKSIVVAVPVASVDIYEEIKLLVDQMICLAKPATLHAVGAWFDNFSQTTDEEVFNIMAHKK